ncbi:MAG: IS3 family transposase [Roseivirga sp.]
MDQILGRRSSLLGLSKSSYYYQKQDEKEDNQALMERIDQIHASYPCYGSRRLVYELIREGYQVGRKRVQRLLRIMRIRAVYPKPGTSQGAREAARYP